MHFHQKSTNHLSNSIKALLLLLITYTTTCNAEGPTPEEIANAMAIAKLDLRTPGKYCGRRLTEAMRTFCMPPIREAIMKSDEGRMVEKKSMDDFDLNQYGMGGGYEEDDMTGMDYRASSVDDLFLSNDIPLLFPSQANRRRRRGIIEECCKRACLKRDLIKFCPIKGG